MGIELGKNAPVFTLKNQDGDKVALKSFRGEGPVVLYFYPKDDTPGCTKEAQAFTKDLKKYAKLGATILGVSPDSEQAHTKFIGKYKLAIDLLVDADHKVAEKYGVWVEKNMYGRKYWGIQRATFLIDTNGKLAHIWPKVKVDGHSADVLTKLKEID